MSNEEKKEKKVKKKTGELSGPTSRERREKNSAAEHTLATATPAFQSDDLRTAAETPMAPSQALACLEITRDDRVPPLEKFIALRRLQR